MTCIIVIVWTVIDWPLCIKNTIMSQRHLAVQQIVFG